MATSSLVNSMLTVTFDGGVDANGKAILLAKRFNGVKPTSLDDQLFSIVQALAPLQTNTIINMKRDNTIDITA